MATKRICSVPGCIKPSHSYGRCRPHHLRFVRYGDPLGGTAKGELPAFVAKALATETDDCILWPYGKAGSGYGVLTVDGRHVYAHRMVCEAANGPMPSGKRDAAHGCGNSSCINKRHLRWATPKENDADKIIHGTTNKGERHGNSKLTDFDVLAIRKRLRQGETQRSVARDFSVHVMTVCNIGLGKRWTHVE